MSWIYRHLIRPVLFAQEAEAIHDITLNALELAGRSSLICDATGEFLRAPELPVEVFGLRFPNPIGLAAGMDKDARAVPVWEALGFGFSELGAVTWLPQPGNPRPRVFRAVAEEAIVNRMGFNNDGAESVARRLAWWRTSGRWPRHPVGVNLGKSKVTPLDKAAEDYARSFRVLHPHADFFVVNVSSPNTPDLRQLQDKALLDEILAALAQVQEQLGVKPLLVKVAPDLSFEALDDVLQITESRKLSGIIATNTTVLRPESVSHQTRAVYGEPGGLSGRPLRRRSTEVIRHLFRQSRGKLPIIGVGGVFDAADAWEKLTAGASLVEIYTGLIYQGPSLCGALIRGLRKRLEQVGVAEIRGIVGVSADSRGV